MANNKYKNNNLTFLNGSVSSIPVESRSIDMIISFETIEHVNKNLQFSFLKEISRVLKANGTLIISTPDKDIYGEGHNEYHIREIDKKEFTSMLKKHFSNIIFYGQDVRAYKNKIALFLLKTLHKLIKMDKLHIRHKIFPRTMRSNIDNKLSDSSTTKNATTSKHQPVLLKDGETAMYLIAICKNN